MKYLVLAWIHTTDFIQRLIKEEKGASAIEYVLIAAVVVGAVSLLSLDDVFTSAVGKLNSAISAAP
ncbi:Flp family type IVb pilin [Photobacterium halotolerans]|uniref:Flp family type IVb pilin n=1 Tax=Photobacterium halotolerans TaxID=265726 RepID=A0A7X5AUH6_9GAMM|nr:Flp family type IVb pilin [Photobacterium halotolerans]NAW65945.1 Flp family type IVb pilin [Photobacterium halotolerans]